jgi:hypothetical protein
VSLYAQAVVVAAETGRLQVVVENHPFFELCVFGAIRWMQP